MLILLSILYNLTLPIWDIQKKQLAKEDVSFLTIIHAPNLVGHTLAIAGLCLLGLFVLPVDMRFYSSWFGMIAIAAVSESLIIYGLLATRFFGVQTLIKLGFAINCLMAVIFLDETLAPLQWLAIGLAAIGTISFMWPERLPDRKIVWDKGIFIVLLAAILGGFASLLYKMATFYTPDYMSFAAGRFFGDLIGWSIVWLAQLTYMRRHPWAELKRCAGNRAGVIMIAGITASTLLSSWLIFKMPLTTYSMLEVLTIPAAWVISHFHYRERMPLHNLAGATCIVLAVIVYLL